MYENSVAVDVSISYLKILKKTVIMSEKDILFTLKRCISLYIFYYFKIEVPNTK